MENSFTYQHHADAQDTAIDTAAGTAVGGPLGGFVGGVLSQLGVNKAIESIYSGGGGNNLTNNINLSGSPEGKILNVYGSSAYYYVLNGEKYLLTETDSAKVEAMGTVNWTTSSYLDSIPDSHQTISQIPTGAVYNAARTQNLVGSPEGKIVNVQGSSDYYYVQNGQRYHLANHDAATIEKYNVIYWVSSDDMNAIPDTGQTLNYIPTPNGWAITSQVGNVGIGPMINTSSDTSTTWIIVGVVVVLVLVVILIIKLRKK